MKIRLQALLPLGAVLAFAMAGADAREVYKYRMPDGKILYTNEVSITGKLLEVLPAPAPAPRVIESERLAKMKRYQEEGERAVSKRIGTLDAVDAEIRLALQMLENAKAAAAAGVEPLPGESMGNRRRPKTGGAGAGSTAPVEFEPATSRLSEPYWERQRALGNAVDDARRRLDAAYLARDQTR